MHNKKYVYKKTKTSYNLEQREYISNFVSSFKGKNGFPISSLSEPMPLLGVFLSSSMLWKVLDNGTGTIAQPSSHVKCRNPGPGSAP